MALGGPRFWFFNFLDDLLAQVQACVTAIERGDSEGARGAMNAHLATVEEFVWENMRKETSVAGGRIGRAGAPLARAASGARAGTNGGRTRGSGAGPRAKRKG